MTTGFCHDTYVSMNTDTENNSKEKPAKAKRKDPIADSIMGLLQAGKPLTFQAAAQQIAEQRRKPKDRKDLWKRYLTAVRQQAIHLAREGKIDLVHRGAVVDPGDFKGLVSMRLKGSSAE
ncbi:MAG: DUF3253 domain-containing protein [Rhodospirillales bacterium]|nr:DUF3253 domain-containing protein [Rhodospirillales bacterium]